MRPATDPSVLARLVTDGLLEPLGDGHRTTRCWRAAMARAAVRLLQTHGDGTDLRLPVIAALVELYADALSDDELTPFVDALLPIELAELDPTANVTPA